ncbi:similar to Saccharomyces cerevisiae YCR010C ADY2 Acetate transporter required for normal sporulation [Maudiozyma saulgeensis]|uniref:Similar to Saccharomyces cerevisiae YCR010C ADY2 Acetate transporter required for normal sporulation n=1 Tax=Maudiozyma saulgeensis TaxID=1789683 RepID=A0A1X7R974_9SACH|nr:similar to Saccharomyces cerevisiae YCR010C ADY2 Acetate transporter required for normal sporulation [Kazachstania saulgeensis]
MSHSPRSSIEESSGITALNSVDSEENNPIYLKHEDIISKKTNDRTNNSSMKDTSDTYSNNDLHSEAQSEGSLLRIFTTGENNQYVYIGRQKFLRSELYEAFGGTLQPGLAPAPVHRFANPAPLGLSAFALTTFVLSMCNARAQGIETPNIVVGLAIFYGGLTQLIAGIWEISLENTFGGTALCSFGGFWLSFGAINIPWFGIIDAYQGKEDELANAMGFYLLGWCIFTWGICTCTMKSTIALFALFFLLGLTFLLLSISEFTRNDNVKRASGVIGTIVSFIAWYNAYAGVANKQNSYIASHPIPLPSNEKVFF